MGWKLTGNTSGVDLEVDTTFKAARVSIRPAEVTGWCSVGAQSGLLTGATANSAWVVDSSRLRLSPPRSAWIMGRW
jgi:hypothetical protein